MAITKLVADSITSGAIASTPAFHASLSASTDISDASDTKLQCNTELYDTDGCYDNSTNYRFTPTTAGKYLIYGSMSTTESADSDLRNVGLMVHKNGSRVDYFGINFRNSFTRIAEINGSTVVDMNGSTDYVELFVFSDTQTNSPTILGGTNQKCFFGGYKLIT